MDKPDLPSASRHDLPDYLAEIDRFEKIVDAWEPEARATVGFYREAIDALNREAFRRLISTLNANLDARPVLRHAVDDAVIYAVLRHHGLLKPSITERVEAALAGVRPMLAEHGGDVEIVRLDPPLVELRFSGACDGCPASALTFRDAVTRAIRSGCPEITDVIQAVR
jgi:Fe-S cluster biogenesis protein NfuA